MYYVAAAALGAYGVFYLRTDPSLGSRLDINSVPVNVVFGLVVAGVVAWTLHTMLEPRLRGRADPGAIRAGFIAIGVAAGVYTAAVLSYPEHLHLTLRPAAGLATTAATIQVAQRVARAVTPRVNPTVVAAIFVIPAAFWVRGAGIYCPVRQDRACT